MRIGTLLCWLFGHCFLYKSSVDRVEDGQWFTSTKFVPTKFCIRCGVYR